MEAQERLAKLYAAELRRLLDPPPNPKVNRPQTIALMREVEDHGASVLDAPDEETWIWSDLHLGHPVAIMAFDRPFRNAGEMDTALVEAWREAVADNETIVRLGDVSAEGCIHCGHERARKEAPGSKVLVLGNHDIDLGWLGG